MNILYKALLILWSPVTLLGAIGIAIKYNVSLQHVLRVIWTAYDK